MDLSFPYCPACIHVARTPLECWASNDVDVDVSSDEETYEATRVVDSNDDWLAPPLSLSSMHILRRLSLDRDPLVLDFCDLSQSHRVMVDEGLFEGGISLPGSSSITEKGHVCLRTCLH